MDKSTSSIFSTVYRDRLLLNESLAKYTTFKIGGPADIFFEAKTTEDFVGIIGEARAHRLPVFILGGGTNVLIGDKGIRGLVVKNNTGRIAIKAVKGERIGGKSVRRVYVEADSGVVFNKLVRFSVEEGLSGIEMHLGLPGTVGGAVYMNSKWTRPEGYVGDVVYQAEMLTPSHELITVPNNYFRFAYDTSSIQKTNDIVVKVIFAFIAADKDLLWKTANESIAYRRETQPQGVMSAGCTFQNITKAESLMHSLPGHTTSVGYLIDHAGLKGYSIGDAEISTVHANFIVNRGKATASDVIQLIDRARDQVKIQFGVELKEEILRVGEF